MQGVSCQQLLTCLKRVGAQTRLSYLGAVRHVCEMWLQGLPSKPELAMFVRAQTNGE